MRTITTTAALLLAALGAPSVAQAGSLGRACTSAPQAQWMSLDALRAQAVAQGYTVRKAKLKEGCAEIYVVDRNGGRAELFVDPASGKVVAQH